MKKVKEEVTFTIAEGWVRVEDEMHSNAGYFTGPVEKSEEVSARGKKGKVF